MARVLVVDDDEATRETLSWALADEGHEVAVAADGQRALELLRVATDRWVVLFDYRMPDLDGEALLSIIAADAHLAARHAYIGMTASPESLPAAVAQFQTQLGVPLLGKPFDLDDLLDTVACAASRLATER
jgi:CheY-like chemotaxis protein